MGCIHRLRALAIGLVPLVALAGDAVAQVGRVALLGCDVIGRDEPEVRFVQISGRIGIGPPLIGDDDFEGDDCAEVLSILMDAGFRVVTSRTVQRNANREIIVYDLILD